ncbi:MAG: DUF1564 family protein [Leptospiraceae bacterium]|nr:DUF1564 family protein [Leptospiraceae bacterium]
MPRHIHFKSRPVMHHRTSSSLRIPANLELRLNSVLARRKMSLPAYLDFLIQRFGPAIYGGVFAPSARPKRLYQPVSGAYLQKNFVPRNESWVAFSQLASFLNWSRCYLFVKLLKLDWKDLLKQGDNFFGVHVPFPFSAVFIYAEVLLKSGYLWKRRLRQRGGEEEH